MINMSVNAQNDEKIKKNIVEQLYWDSRVDASNIKVEVCNGQVTLKGRVPSYSVKLCAEADSMTIQGVTSINDDLEIQYHASVKLPTDIEIQGNIVNSLIWNTNIDSTDINVSVDNGIVTLDGSVPSYWQKILVEELTYNMAGVLSTVNKLSVVPTENIIDESLADAIIASIDRSTNIDVDTVNVQVDNGLVTLSGSVPNRAAYYDALNSARRTVGVVNVINNLRVESF